jgi:hypothetical protein
MVDREIRPHHPPLPQPARWARTVKVATTDATPRTTKNKTIIDPLYRIRGLLRRGREHLNTR